MTSRVVAYCRVSTTEQDPAAQELAIRNAGYNPSRVVHEKISGGVPAFQRPEFAAMVKHGLDKGDTLVVLKLDRLGRDNIDINQTIDTLTEAGIKVVSLDLPIKDLSSVEGRLMRQLMGAFSEFEKGRIRERTIEGLARAKAANPDLKVGRPVADKTTAKVQACKKMGMTQSQAADHLQISVRTIKRHWGKEIAE